MFYFLLFSFVVYLAILHAIISGAASEASPEAASETSSLSLSIVLPSLCSSIICIYEYTIFIIGIVLCEYNLAASHCTLYVQLASVVSRYMLQLLASHCA